MESGKISRRKAIETSLIGSLAALGGLGFTTNDWPRQEGDFITLKNELPFRISLNTSTLMAYQLPVDEQIKKVAATGFDGIELWMRDIRAFLDKGGSRSELKELLEGGNLKLENIIGFSAWCSDDAEERKKALEQLHKEMEITAGLGGSHIAAPVMGLKSLDPAKFGEYTERYLAILAIEAETGVVPIIEIWGAGVLHKISDCARIVIATGHPKATMLLDFYHIYRGGNDWDTVDILNGGKLPVIHMNDYPAEPARELLIDGHRLLPGEGICPYDTVLPKLYEAGFRGGLSVELFNKGYWETMDAETMLKNSYQSTLEVVTKAMSVEK
jgi:2-keto-myo-inositol isomerase